MCALHVQPVDRAGGRERGDRSFGVGTTTAGCRRRLSPERDALAGLIVERRDMNAPRLRLYTLRGSLQGFYAVTVSGNWRVIFRFEDGDALDVDYLDHH